ncbi:hypothetical protein [Streptomyces albidoflavus]|uniref:hypothetical protein n=1 Tax=Streptomyces albidoflavus TaxID=1886 RepID=UPI003426D960
MQDGGGQVEPDLFEEDLGGDGRKLLGQVEKDGRFLLLALVLVGARRFAARSASFFGSG